MQQTLRAGGIMCAVYFILALSWGSVAALPLPYCWGTGPREAGSLPKIPAVEPEFEPGLYGFSCGPHTASLYPVPQCAFATPSARWPQPGSVGVRGRKIHGRKKGLGWLPEEAPGTLNPFTFQLQAQKTASHHHPSQPQELGHRVQGSEDPLLQPETRA